MEDFYNNPFVNQEEEDALCYADVPPQRNPEESATLGADDNGKVMGSNESLLGLSSALRFQSQLCEAMRANASLRTTYEAHIQAQSQEIDRLGAENSKLMSKLTAIESQLRSMALEKECAAMAYKREVEKNITLEEKITSLEAELNSFERRTRDLAAMYSRTPRQKAQHQQLQTSTPARPSESLLHTPVANRRGLGNSFEGHPSRAIQLASAPQFPGASHHNQEQQSKFKNTNSFDTRGDKVVDHAMIQQLEKQLMHQSLEKEEIERQLQKVENMRLRTVTERAKKMSLERELEVAQRNVGELRRRLRVVSALVR